MTPEKMKELEDALEFYLPNGECLEDIPPSRLTKLQFNKDDNIATKASLVLQWKRGELI